MPNRSTHAVTVAGAVAAAVALCPCSPIGEKATSDVRRLIVLEGNTSKLTIDLGGGSIVNFHLLSGGLNPLRWGEEGKPGEARPMGHFLCLDRWGPPSDAEAKRGMPFHGEASHVEWKVTRPAEAIAKSIRAEMEAMLPIAGLKVNRKVELSGDQGYFVVRESVTNENKLGRIFNMVQHPTIGPPFLDEQTVVDSNARRGFYAVQPAAESGGGRRYLAGSASRRPAGRHATPSR